MSSRYNFFTEDAPDQKIVGKHTPAYPPISELPVDNRTFHGSKVVPKIVPRTVRMTLDVRNAQSVAADSITWNINAQSLQPPLKKGTKVYLRNVVTNVYNEDDILSIDGLSVDAATSGNAREKLTTKIVAVESEPSNSFKPFGDSVIAYYDFATPTKLGLDVSGNNNNGIPINCTWSSNRTNSLDIAAGTTSNPGRIDVSCLKKTLRGKRNVTLSFWFKHANTTGVMAFFSLTNRLSSNSHDYIIFWYAGTMAFVLRNASGTQLIYKEAKTVDTGITYNDGNWHHVVATHGDAGSKLWIDNKLCINETDTNSWDSVDIDYALIGSARRIATNDEFFYPYTGSMSDLIIIDRQVDAEFARKLYQDNYGFDLIWLGGQSNMEGRGTVVAGVDDDYSQTTGKVYQYPVKANAVPATLGIGQLQTRFLDGLTATSKAACRAAFACINVNFAYVGPIFKLRRNYDNVIDTFWASAYGELINAGGVPVETWLNATQVGIALVDTWYDQSGMGNHATQPDVMVQPIYDVVNKMVNFRPNRFLLMPDGTIPTGAGPYTIMTKHGASDTVAGDQTLFKGGVGANQSLGLIKLADNKYRFFWWANDHDFGTYAAGNVVAETYDGATRVGYVNGAIASTKTAVGRNTIATENRIGTGNSGVFKGDLYYIYAFSTNLPDSEVSLLSTNHFVPKVTNATNTLDFPRNFAGPGGLWRTMCLPLLNRLPARRKILLLPGAYTASGFHPNITNTWNSWRRGDALYNTNINMLNQAYGIHPMNVMKGAVFLLGETEAVHASTQFLSDLKTFLDNLKMDTTCITDETPFVWGGIAVTDASVPVSVRDKINSDLQTFVNSRYIYEFIKTVDLTLLDGWHYNMTSLRTLGERFAGELFQVSSRVEDTRRSLHNCYAPSISPGVTLKDSSCAFNGPITLSRSRAKNSAYTSYDLTNATTSLTLDLVFVEPQS
jgi:hypothetical protein